LGPNPAWKIRLGGKRGGRGAPQSSSNTKREGRKRKCATKLKKKTTLAQE